MAIGIGLMGLGTIGYGVYSLLMEKNPSPSSLTLKRILIKDPKKSRPPILENLLTTDPNAIIKDPQIQILIEVIGGLNPPLEYIKAALYHKKHVITANKLLMAIEGERLLQIAEKTQRNLLYEASVGGGIPLISLMRDALIYPPQEIWGIINGTTNYILTQMDQRKISFQEALKGAQERGYAEADPTSDISGEDAACKLAIMASMAFRTKIPLTHIPYRGIGEINPLDLEIAQELGYVIKLLALAIKRRKRLTLKVEPVLIEKDHPLARIDGVTNGVYLKGNILPYLFLSGPGAGMFPTAHSILADLMSILKNKGRFIGNQWTHLEKLDLSKEEKDAAPFYVRFLEYHPPFLSLLKDNFPVKTLIENKGGLSSIITIRPHHFQSFLTTNQELAKLAALYPIKGGDNL